MSSWEETGTVSRDELANARLVTHHALQLVGIGIGRSLVPPADDDSHTSLDWSAEGRHWLGPEVPGTDGLRGFLRPEDLTLGLLDGRGNRTFEHGLEGETLEGAFTRLREALAAHGADASRVSLESHFETPPHPLQSDQPFPKADRAFGELARWFANGDRLLHELADPIPGASPVRTWPHHFDVGGLLPVDPDGTATRSVGIGMSPGDKHYPEPYFYVSPYPEPPVDYLPDWTSPGHWKREPFVSLILTATEIEAMDSPAEGARRFLSEAVTASRKALETAAGEARSQA